MSTNGKIASPLINEALKVKTKAITPTVSKEPNKSGRLITIPLHVLDKIDTTAAFALKLNNETFRIDPSRLIKTSSGMDKTD